MEQVNLEGLWQEQTSKIKQRLALNEQVLQQILGQKAASVTNKFKGFKIRGIIIALLYLFVVGSVLFYTAVHFDPSASYFMVSVAAIFLINVKVLADYIKHLVWANKVDFDGPVIAIQEQLAALELSLFSHARITILQLPFWTTFYLSPDWFPAGTSLGWIIFQVIITGLSIFITCWLYKNLRMQNAHKKWVRLLIEGAGGKSVYKAMAICQQIESYQNMAPSLNR